MKSVNKASRRVLLQALLLWSSLATGLGLSAAAAEPPRGMLAIKAGVYRPLYSDTPTPAAVAVEAFYLDTYAVTNAQYLAFVQANPRWRRTHIPRLFAEAAYLQAWPDELPVTDTAWGQRPVTQVSWFAARAYCKWQDKRLPSVAEWEYVAMASDTAPDGRQDTGYLARMLTWYAQPTPVTLPPVGSQGVNYWGVYDLHGLIWEWTEDFHTAMVTGESRGDSNLERNLFCGAGVVGSSGQERVNYPAFMRYAYRSSLRGSYTVPNLGFRCAKEAP